MNNDKRDDLLIRMDERVEYMHDALKLITVKVESHDDDIKNVKSSIRFMKWIGVVFTGIVAFLKDW